ncbi:PRC-barrel domain protein [Humitalea rosea]|uniref:PRC-barrel domain protein n=1 Tax=Humitalea rosea TaxID=990373 RepID=A0A2W7IFW6_9PROT|nr:PRC-barrel domain-containing protein [Humitalea rosea]PZW45846.1 PRC-barrel domain protein [Humitalea rosea]
MRARITTLILLGTLATVPAMAQTATTPQRNTPAGLVTVDAIRLTGGLRASRIIGAAVSNPSDERIGSVEDLVVTQQDRVLVAIIQVGGFLGLGGKLVAIPFSDLRIAPDNKVTLAGATKESLRALPAFTFGN